MPWKLCAQYLINWKFKRQLLKKKKKNLTQKLCDVTSQKREKKEGNR